MRKERTSIKLSDGSQSLGLGIILTIYLVLKPLYLFSSGLPQISDMFLIAAALYMLVRERGKILIPNEYSTWINTFILTLIFQIIVQAVWWMKTSENQMLLMATYYVFNFIASLLCIYIGKNIGPEKLKLAICKGCFYSIIVTAVGFVVRGGSGIRSTGFFNNPNQLGYYSLLILTIIAFFPDQLPKWQNAIIIVISLWANVVSLSKASIIGFAGLAICYALWGSKEKTLRKAVSQALLLLVIFGAIYWFLFSSSSIVIGNRTLYILRNRILYMSAENDSALGSGRGYDRVQEMGIHLLWGMGEGAYQRFKIMTGYEVHATFINTLVSYGAIGFIAYIWLMGKPMISRGRSVRNLACFSGLFLYFFTHNGIRNTLLWILIAAVLQANTLGVLGDEQEVL